MGVPVVEPTTPRKAKKDHVAALVRGLDEDYNLGVSIPDPSETPSNRQRRAAKDRRFARSDQIYQGFHFLYFRQDDSLERVHRLFFHRTTKLAETWPTSFQHEVIPGGCPRASTPDQQVALQELLITILTDVRTSLSSANLHERSKTQAGASFSGKPVVVDELPVSVRPKRPSFDTHESKTKRPRSQTRPYGMEEPSKVVWGTLDEVKTRHKVADEGPGMVFPSPQVQSFTSDVRPNSVNTSRRSIAPTIFSHVETTGSSQSTVEITSQEAKDVYQYVHESDDFAPSSSEMRVLNESFSRHESRHFVPSDDERTVLGRDVLMNHVEVPPEVVPGVDIQTHGPLSELLDGRLQNIWPQFPPWLAKAPFIVAWEITRICLHCKVDIMHPSLVWKPEWATQSINETWKSLLLLPIFHGKSGPELPDEISWEAALNNGSKHGEVVMLSLVFEYNIEAKGPLFLIRMKPPRLDKSCRLSRRFGPDRFLDVLMPSPCGGGKVPKIMQRNGAASEVIEWLTQQTHSFVGREWAPFFVRDAGYRRPTKEFRLGPEHDKVFMDRVHFFAESGAGFYPLSPELESPPSSERSGRRSEFRVQSMLKWLLAPEHNSEQPHLKLFNRVQLGLSSTVPAMVFKPSQIRHRRHDIRSPTGKVMNDGIALMSRSVALKLRDLLGMTNVPSAVQARLGSAKGMWLLDVRDESEEDWVETYPQQRKWVCDFVDEHHRTFEIKTAATELTSSGLNLQFLPVLEHGVDEPKKMRLREVLSQMLISDLEQEFSQHKLAMQHPEAFRLWCETNGLQRSARAQFLSVPRLGGLPLSKEDTVTFLLESGFKPSSQKYLQDVAWQLQKQKCESLKTKLKIKVSRSTYAYMVVDFWGLLEEGEVHLGFSSKFASDEYNDTMVHGQDVLVARSPAHLPSDIQRVRAVFKMELRELKDVIVFSAKGNVPLADKLSGGDYDGDKAWVCWDPRIVEAFTNHEIPSKVDLSQYMTKDKTTYAALRKEYGARATSKMIERGFQFSMRPNMLGICTNFKERYCYHRNSVGDAPAILLSWLLSELVDQPKNGISFTTADFERLKQQALGRAGYLKEPAYKEDVCTGPIRHIIDHLKFAVARPAIDRELQAFHEAMVTSSGDLGSTAAYWDADLKQPYDHFRALRSRSCTAMLEDLKGRLAEVELLWKKTMAKWRADEQGYAERVREVHAAWCDVRPVARGRDGAKIDSKMVALLAEDYLAEPELSAWARLKASTAFAFYYGKSPKFVWAMAGFALGEIKAKVTAKRGSYPRPVTARMYAGLRSDKRLVKMMMAVEAQGSSAAGSDLSDVDEEDAQEDEFPY